MMFVLKGQLYITLSVQFWSTAIYDVRQGHNIIHVSLYLDDSNFQAPPSKRVRTTKPGGGTKRRERQSKKVVSDGASPRLTRSQSRLRRRVENDIERESQRWVGVCEFF